jgi:hypothetical protein
MPSSSRAKKGAENRNVPSTFLGVALRVTKSKRTGVTGPAHTGGPFHGSGTGHDVVNYMHLLPVQVGLGGGWVSSNETESWLTIPFTMTLTDVYCDVQPFA